MSEPSHTTQVRLPMLPMREDIIYPGMTVPFFIGRKQSMEAVERALNTDRSIFVVTQRDTSVERPDQGDDGRPDRDRPHRDPLRGRHEQQDERCHER